MSDLYSIHDVVRNTVNRLLMDVHTTIPAKVLEYNSTKQTVKVQVAVSRPVSNGANIAAGTYHDIPMVFPSAAKWVIAGPVNVGDLVLLLVPHYGTQEFMAGDGVRLGDSSSIVKHDLNDAVAVPGIFTQKAPTIKPAHKDKFHLANGETSVVLINEGDITLQVGGTILKVSSTGVDITGALTVNGIPFATHVHAYQDSPVGPSVTAVPQ